MNPQNTNVLVVTLILALIVFFAIIAVRSVDNIPEDKPDIPQRVSVLNEATCTAAAGNWNPCGSACRARPDDICIEVCVEYCECRLDQECPQGFTCQEFVDRVGICKL